MSCSLVNPVSPAALSSRNSQSVVGFGMATNCKEFPDLCKDNL